MKLGVYIAHAGWMPGRRETLDRLLKDLPDAIVVESKGPEHASTWASRLYDRALTDAPDHACFLNDDVFVCPRFVEVLNTMHLARPDDVLALHTTSPMAQMLLAARQRWFRAFWLTGPAYSFPLDRLKSLVAYRARIPRWFIESRNEDNVAMQWMWHEQKPAWHPIPAIVKHDTTVPSSLGYDKHPLRAPTFTWEHTPIEITPSFWFPNGTPILFECPWLPSPSLALHQQMIEVP